VELSIPIQQHMAQALVAAVQAATALLPNRQEVRLAALEGALEQAVWQVRGRLLELALEEVGSGYVGSTRPCACGAEQTTDHYASATWQTVLGPVVVRRAAYRCAACGTQQIPLDQQLGLGEERTSPHLRARVGLFGSAACFAEASELLEQATGVQVSPKQAQLLSEALGARWEQQEALAVPAAPPTAPGGRLYLGMDGVMYCTTEQDAQKRLMWREAKVGVFYQALPTGAPGTGRHSRLAPGGPAVDVADPESHSYVVHMGDWQGFAEKVWQEGRRRGVEQAPEVVLLSDGGVWIESVRRQVLDGLGLPVTHILDLRHAEEHLWAVARACLGEEASAWVTQPPAPQPPTAGLVAGAAPLDHLVQGRVDALIAALRALMPREAKAAELVETTCAYYDQRRAMMNYPRFRAQGYQIGSGLAESACKRLVGQRQKGPGMHWTVAGAQAIGSLRAAALSHRWDEVVALACAA
jgi:hypothetical protein